MATESALKQQIIATLDTLPPEGLQEVLRFLDYLRYKFLRREEQHTPYQPVALGGLWKGVEITEEDIAEIRREMWQGFGEREL